MLHVGGLLIVISIVLAAEVSYKIAFFTQLIGILIMLYGLIND